MHIGILVTNTDGSHFAEQHPRDGEKFTRLMKQVRPHWRYPVFNCVAGEFPPQLDQCDGYIVGGSPASVHDAEPWIARLFDLIRSAEADKLPLVGCCFGHQAIAQALGGSVIRNPAGWGFGVATTHVEKQQDWMQPKLADIGLYAAHSEQVGTLPQGAEVYGGSAFCPVGGFVIGRHVMTTEYHPEITHDFFVGLTHAFEKYIGAEVSEEARRQAQVPAQGVIFAEWMARFFEQAKAQAK